MSGVTPRPGHEPGHERPHDLGPCHDPPLTLEFSS